MCCSGGVLALGSAASAGELSPAGGLEFTAAAELTLDFEDADALPALECEACSVSVQESAADELALEGDAYLALSSDSETLRLSLLPPALPSAGPPGLQRSGRYEARLWVRHARVIAHIARKAYATRDLVPLYPTGRTTSDGWVELASAAIDLDPLGAASAPHTAPLEELSLEVQGSGVQLDAFELIRLGDYQAEKACLGAFDSACGAGELCVAERCRDINQLVPPLPDAEHRTAVAEYLMQRVELIFGGGLTRREFRPAALEAMRGMLTASSAADYWGAYERGVRLLHDAHTVMRSTLRGVRSDRRLAACFIEGRADLSQGVWASNPAYADILVSHVGASNNLGLIPGDRLVAVDGLHPIAWARSIISVNARYRSSTDPDVYGELVEQLHDQIPSFARTFSVVRCDPLTAACSDRVETLSVAALPISEDDQPGCDNRPRYHQLDPPEGAELHRLEAPWRSLVSDATDAERIYGVTWNDLLPDEAAFFRQSNALFKAEARGVILDHRTGNGGVLDAPTAITELVRTPQLLSIGSFMSVAADDFPQDSAAGVSLFSKLLTLGGAGLAFEVGSDSPDLALPVALLIHRDASASDWLPHGMKGAPMVRIFGPHETAGAFSSFYQFDYWSGFGAQLASGDTVTAQGEMLIGHGIAPDEVVEHTQSDLLAGRDAPYLRALAWVRSNLK